MNTFTVIIIRVHRLTCYERLVIHLFRGSESYPIDTLPMHPTQQFLVLVPFFIHWYMFQFKVDQLHPFSFLL